MRCKTLKRRKIMNTNFAFLVNQYNNRLQTLNKNLLELEANVKAFDNFYDAKYRVLCDRIEFCLSEFNFDEIYNAYIYTDGFVYEHIEEILLKYHLLKHIYIACEECTNIRQLFPLYKETLKDTDYVNDAIDRLKRSYQRNLEEIQQSRNYYNKKW